MAIRKVCLAGVCLFTGVSLVSCGQSASVRSREISVTPITASGIQKAVQNSGAKAVLVNVWATWCGPCREEFPGLIRVARKYRDQGLNVLLVSADDNSDLGAVKKFLARQGVDFPSYLKAEKDQQFIDGLDKRWSGALPATFIYDGSGHLRDFWEGEASSNKFEQAVSQVLAAKPKSTGGNP